MTVSSISATAGKKVQNGNCALFENLRCINLLQDDLGIILAEKNESKQKVSKCQSLTCVFVMGLLVENVGAVVKHAAPDIQSFLSFPSILVFFATDRKSVV